MEGMRIFRHPVSDPPTRSLPTTGAEVTSFSSPVTVTRGDVSVTWHTTPAMTGFTVAAGDREILVTADHAAEFIERFGAVVELRTQGGPRWAPAAHRTHPSLPALVVDRLTNGVAYEVRAAWGTPQGHGQWAYAPPLVPMSAV